MELPDFLTRDDSGEIRLTGHRIGLYTVLRCFNEGQSPEAIAEEFPTLPPSLVRQVLDFYHNNQAEVDAYLAAYRAEIERQASQPPGPGVLAVRRILEAKERARKQ
jgi:uncharacterized protein (DUF433 family)